MKKLLSAAAAIAAMSALTLTAFADAEVHVSIANEFGKLAIADEHINVSDVDGDGNLTINDALIITHDELFNGGSEEGYAYMTGEYGTLISKLWGVENGGSYGYYVNNKAANSLDDTISDGDHINAFIYTDLEAWSDRYCYFDRDHVEFDIHEGDVPTFDLTLTAATFDENWNPIEVPVAGAKITINFAETEFVTDENGYVEITLPEGTPNPNIANEYYDYIITAESDTETLVPPVCTVKVVVFEDAAAEAIADDEEVVVVTGNVDAATDSSKGSPDTGVADVAAVTGITVIAAGAFIVSRKRK